MKLTFKTKYFYAEFELTAEDNAFEAIDRVKDMIEYAESIEFPVEDKSMPATAQITKDPATAKQLEILDKHGIAYNSGISKDEASDLIKASMALSQKVGK